MVAGVGGRASVWRREKAKNRSGEEMAEEGLIALALESTVQVCFYLLCIYLLFLLELQFPS